MKRALLIFLLILICSCSGGSGGDQGSGFTGANFSCSGTCANQNLTIGDVELILRQAISAAGESGLSATIAISDRVGNVLAVYQMLGALATSKIDGQIGAVGGLEGVDVPATFAAISKAGTAAFLSSQGNAFSTRTASQIIQENFNPGENNQPGGPLFGVQFSQLPCSDVTTNSGTIGPKALPLGLSADPGGIPLYKNGDLVGGIGVELDGLYSLDRNLNDRDSSPEEYIALQASRNFEFPAERAAERIFVLGKSLRISDLSYSDLSDLPATLSDLDPSRLISGIAAGVTYGTLESGVLKTARRGIEVAILVNSAGGQRFPARGGSSLGGSELSTHEVEALLDSVLFTANRTRAAIRRPLDNPAQVSIWIVDHIGRVLGMVRSSDAPVFGLDVALQKARTAAFFSSPEAGVLLSTVQARSSVFEDYVGRVRAFLGADALTGNFAFSDRAGGNLSRPFFPDGINGNSNGPFSHPFPGTATGKTWSPFNTGLQLDLIFEKLVAGLSSQPDSCTDSAILGERLRNGMQIFPGSVPLYRGNTLIGGIGISGDGIDQDDLIAFYGASRQGLDFAGHTSIGNPTLGFNAPKNIRADNIETPVGTARLRYVNCPESPFVDSNEQKVCHDL